MNDERAKRLAELAQLYQSGLLSEDTYRAAVAGLDAAPLAQADLKGAGAIAQGDDSQAVGREGIGVRGDLGIGVTGDQNIIVIATEVAESFWRQFQPRRLSPEELQQATSSYLTYLLDRYRYLDFKGMGVSDRVPLRLPLVEMYVPLKARIELPAGETWTRQLRLAGRAVSPDEAEAIGQRLSEPRPVLELLQQQPGLIILGDPGAGKTTFLKYLALGLATGQGEALGLGNRLPILLPLSAYANALVEKDVALDRFIPDYYRDRGVDLPLGPMLNEALEQGGALLLLDGLDEVKELGQRSLVVEQMRHFFSLQQRRGNKFILTSRIVGYREVRPTQAGLVECTLVDFEAEEIGEFISRWTGALERAARGDTAVAAQEAAQEAAELRLAVERNPGVRRLAANPLLLTILALMKRQGVTLPERRVELYQKYVETLLKTWNLARGLGRPATRDLDVVETLKVLAPLALWMHQTSPGIGLVKREAMRRELERIYRERGVTESAQAAQQFLADVRDHASLLLERGAGEYGFIHLTFQEYLAAVALAQQGQSDIGPVAAVLAAHLNDETWREVSLLTTGYIGIIQQRDQAAGELVQRLTQQSPLGAILAGEAVCDAGPGGVTGSDRARVVEILVKTMRAERQVEPRLRVAAGAVLGRLGDPRFRADAGHLPDEPLLGFVKIPPGPFLMGTRHEDIPSLLKQFKGSDRKWYEREVPQHSVDLPAYYISRYPVTVGQWRAFVRDSGHQPTVKQSLDDPDNQPVRYVTWYEAITYCRWLEASLGHWVKESEAAPHLLALVELIAAGGWRVTLPSEAEWEKAARGTDGRNFPWGSQADPNRANYGDTRINNTSAVGCFPGGASPYGCEELSGNVWEWTRSLWGTDSDKPDFKYPYNSADGREDLGAGTNVLRVLRGGAFNFNESLARCAFRNRNYPDSRINYIGYRVVVSPIL